MISESLDLLPVRSGRPAAFLRSVIAFAAVALGVIAVGFTVAVSAVSVQPVGGAAPAPFATPFC